MRVFARTDLVVATVMLGVGMATVAGAPPAAAQGACPGFDRRHTITRLGGRHALSPAGLQSRAELQAYFAAHQDEIRSIFAGRGHGPEVADALLEAIRDGAAITERPILAGERLEWMAYRDGGVAMTIEDVCLSLAQPQPAFEIVVPVVTATDAPSPDCSLEVATDCRPGGTSTFTIRAPAGAQVTLESPSGERTELEMTEAGWSGPMESPYQPDVSFTVTNASLATETVTSYTFMVPRECVNLALVGRSEGQRSGAPVRCEQRHPQPVCPTPPPPTCSVELDRSEVRRGEPVHFRVSATGTELNLELLRDGAPTGESLPALPGGAFVPRKRGTYTVVGNTVNEVGAASSCQASVEVVGADWILRPFGSYLAVDGGTVSGAVPIATAAKSCPCAPDTTYGYDDGYGLGVSLERRLGERLGVELRAQYGRLDDDLWIGANGLAVEDDGTADFWDLSLGLNVHLTPSRALDWYAGPFVGYNDVEGAESLAFPRSLELDPEGGVAWGLQTGLDWPFGDSPWALHVGARYTWSELDVTRRYTSPQGVVHESSGSLDLDPVSVDVGFAYHF